MLTTTTKLQPGTDKSECIWCEEGEESDGLGNCIQCSNNEISSPYFGQTHCEPCPHGKKPTDTKSSCEYCENGFESVSGSCVQCSGNIHLRI